MTSASTVEPTINDTKGITMAAAKSIYKELVTRFKAGEDSFAIDVYKLIEGQDLWLSDEWTHVGHCIVVCLNNKKLIGTYNKGNNKILDSLIGKTIKEANMTVDAELIKELMPLIIKTYFHNE